jgi:hypothetical protein
MQYDIIGDIHGFADKLEGLLLKLGYTKDNGIYHQEGHTCVFVGDFIDRGIQNRRVIEIVRNMVDYGHAYAVMGNHEYNAICYHTKTTETDYLRPHNRKNFHQHEKFLNEYPLDHKDTKVVIDWFKSLPLFLEFDYFRIIHACWDQQAIEDSKPYLDGNNALKREFIAESADKDKRLFGIIERLLKGVEVELPHDVEPFVDKDGTKRREIRVRWWSHTDGTSYQEMAIGYDEEIIKNLPDDISPDSTEIPIYNNEKPVFFGHYWMVGTPRLQSDMVCCVDFSAGKGGNLVTYRFAKPNECCTLDAANFKWYEHKQSTVS